MSFCFFDFSFLLHSHIEMSLRDCIFLNVETSESSFSRQNKLVYILQLGIIDGWARCACKNQPTIGQRFTILRF